MILHEEPATVGQRMLWLLARHRGTAGRLNYPLFLRLRGPLDTELLQRTVDELVARHEALRTTFARRTGLLTQLVHAPGPVTVRRLPLPPDAGADGRLAADMYAEATSSLDPARCPLRATLWRLDETDHTLCLNAHHLVTDAWSARVLTDELVHLLSGGAPLPRVAWQYRHFARWQHRRTPVEQWRADEDYWRTQLAGVTPFGRWREEVAGTPVAATDRDTAIVHLDLDSTLCRRIEGIARGQQATTFGVLLAFFYSALGAETGRSDLCVGAPFANRTRPESTGTVGLFANLVMLRTRLPADGDFPGLVARTRDTVNAAISHQGYPYYLLAPEGGPSRADRFDEIVFQMVPELPERRRAGELDVEVLVPQLPTRFDLELAAVPYPGGVRLRLQYAPDRVAAATATRIARRYHDAVVRAVA